MTATRSLPARFWFFLLLLYFTRKYQEGQVDYFRGASWRDGAHTHYTIYLGRIGRTKEMGSGKEE